MDNTVCLRITAIGISIVHLMPGIFGAGIQTFVVVVLILYFSQSCQSIPEGRKLVDIGASSYSFSCSKTQNNCKAF